MQTVCADQQQQPLQKELMDVLVVPSGVCYPGNVLNVCNGNPGKNTTKRVSLLICNTGRNLSVAAVIAHLRRSSCRMQGGTCLI